MIYYIYYCKWLPNDGNPEIEECCCVHYSDAQQKIQHLLRMNVPAWIEKKHKCNNSNCSNMITTDKSICDKCNSCNRT